MAMDMDQAQRRDIDTTLNSRVSLVLDDENATHSPYSIVAENFVGNNWLKSNNSFVKQNIAEEDSIVFTFDALTNLSEKTITKITVSFDYSLSNISANMPVLNNISFTTRDVTNYVLVENTLSTQGHIEVDCQIFDFSSILLDTAISEQGFDIGLNFDGFKSNVRLNISNVVIEFEFENKLQEEMDAVSNRLSANFDIFVEDDDLIIDFLGDGTATGGGGSGGTDVETVNRLISTALDKLSIDMSVDLLNNGYVRLNADINKGDE